MDPTIEDLMKDSGIQSDEPVVEDDIASVKNELKAELSKLQSEISSRDAALQAANRDREELVRNMAYVVGSVEATGMGKFDPTTGKIIRTESPVDEIKEIENQIKEIDANLRKQLDDGEITESEYWREIEKQRSPLKDQLADIKVNRRIEEATKKIQQSVPTQPEKSITDKYNEIASQFPDANNQDSALFKEMDRIFRSNPQYANANPGSANPNPELYKDLAIRASELLEAKGINVNKTKARNIEGQFSSPDGEGYRHQDRPKSNLSKGDMNLLVNLNYSNPDLIKEINQQMGEWEKTGSISLKG